MVANEMGTETREPIQRPGDVASPRPSRTDGSSLTSAAYRPHGRHAGTARLSADPARAGAVGGCCSARRFLSPPVAVVPLRARHVRACLWFRRHDRLVPAVVWVAVAIR
jgi:hypothetical protein